MFFMVTYGSLCLISFLQHFAADPSYRPSFRSKWYFSLIGALMCFGLMFWMNSGYAIISVILLILVPTNRPTVYDSNDNMEIIDGGQDFKANEILVIPARTGINFNGKMFSPTLLH